MPLDGYTPWTDIQEPSLSIPLRTVSDCSWHTGPLRYKLEPRLLSRGLSNLENTAITALETLMLFKISPLSHAHVLARWLMFTTVCYSQRTTAIGRFLSIVDVCYFWSFTKSYSPDFAAFLILLKWCPIVLKSKQVRWVLRVYSNFVIDFQFLRKLQHIKSG